jgi:hypothetical protein
MAYRAQTLLTGFNQATPAMQSTLQRSLGTLRSAYDGLQGSRRTRTSRARSKKSSSGSLAKVKVLGKRVGKRTRLGKVKVLGKKVGRRARLKKGSAAAKAWGRKMKALRAG